MMKCHICGKFLDVDNQKQYFEEVLFAHYGIVPDSGAYHERGHTKLSSENEGEVVMSVAANLVIGKGLDALKEAAKGQYTEGQSNKIVEPDCENCTHLFDFEVCDGCKMTDGERPSEYEEE